MDPSKQDSLTGKSELPASESKSQEIVTSNTMGPEANSDGVSQLRGDSRVSPASADSIPWKRLRPLELIFVWSLRNLNGGNLQRV